MQGLSSVLREAISLIGTGAPWLMAVVGRSLRISAGATGWAAAFARVVGEAGSALVLGGAGATMAAAIASQGHQQAWSRAAALGFVLSVLAIGTAAVAVRLRDDGG